MKWDKFSNLPEKNMVTHEGGLLASSVLSGSRKKRSKIGLQRVSEVAGYLTLGIFFGESSKVYLQ
jgi:hypothetical protein